MSRGAPAPIGQERVSQNGYHYTKTGEGWVLTHRMLAEERLGRALRPDERVIFINRNRTDVRPENLQVVHVNTNLKALKKRRQDLIIRIEELQGQLADLTDEIHRREITGT